MSTNPLETDRFQLVLPSLAEARAGIDAMAPEKKAELSADWLALFEAATAPDPWIHGLNMIRKSDGAIIGSIGFKGPPDSDGVAEIAYAVEPEHQGNGFATEAARAMVDYAYSDDRVRLVRAHTLPESNASTRVLTKCGFQNVGEVVDPDDGPVWRWELEKTAL